MINTPEQEEQLRETLKYFAHPRGAGDLGPNSLLANPENLEKTYEISVYLKDYKPRTSRKFRISGRASMMTLQMALILMFNGQRGSHVRSREPEDQGDVHDAGI